VGGGQWKKKKKNQALTPGVTKVKDSGKDVGISNRGRGRKGLERNGRMVERDELVGREHLLITCTVTFSQTNGP